jgi:WS/DGAT/MGAT family acyltransferase
MQQLTPLDAANLYMETSTSYWHVATLIIFDGATSDGATLGRMKERYRERLPLLTPMRRKLVEVPLHLDYPYWADDHDLDLDEHIHQISLKPPVDVGQLAELVAELTARPLDRSRPLWQLYVIDGLPDGRIAHLTLCHHATADGVAFVRMLMNLLDHDAAGGHEPVPEPTHEVAPTRTQMLGHSLASFASQPLRQGRVAAKLLSSIPRIAGTLRHASLREAPPTPFNDTIGPHRAVAFTSIPLGDIRAVKDAVGVTVNDVVLGTCAGAVRAYLERTASLPEESLRAMIPVSVRTDEEPDVYGNRVSATVTSLHTDVEDPIERLRLIAESMAVAKQAATAIPGDVLGDLEALVPAVVVESAVRVIGHVRPFNVVVSNVPGPRIPLFAGGAEMLHYYPFAPVVDGLGLNISLFSYAGQIEFGLNACRDLVPDVSDLCTLLHDSFDELRAELAAIGLEPTADIREPEQMVLDEEPTVGS